MTRSATTQPENGPPTTHPEIEFTATQPESEFPATDLFGFADRLSEAERAKLHALDALLDEQVRPYLAEWWERAECPVHVRGELARLRLEDDPDLLRGDGTLNPQYVGFRHFMLARCDLSVATLYGGQVGMFRTVVREGGSPEQRAQLDPLIVSFELTGCFALTEPDHGSDVARGLETVATRHGDTWRINGHKRWIGNAAVSDVIVVVAKDSSDGAAKAFMVPREAPGVAISDVGSKLSLRMVRNADIRLTDVEVDESARLQRIDSFADIAAILAHLRPVVAWNAAGMQAGAYEAALRYATHRHQFGRPIAGYQLIQDKLARMLGNATASLAMAARLSDLRSQGRGGDAHSALTKAWTSDRLRETVALAREICGGEGIRVGNDVARYFADAEAVYTFEGTREINHLIVGRAATGLSAFTR
ncbi:acyl-CoA dehydrogenase family protein [Phytoactinopolyspora halotolerans]|uniref:Glutaryl-CoA dehydrogenase n=1 Tax=Phytoactinopolyspora halotolerans TaxID=1981512 RepID=A0A6L9S686_9ACTN|nr:acyl-CoA dehydrogenase family protein [Phytoactinopolyspora halotolerans]NEE00483.1 glutaryl-CoA dehydrogenase [Phytoactinopolyspora halotolerans]